MKWLSIILNVILLSVLLVAGYQMHTYKNEIARLEAVNGEEVEMREKLEASYNELYAKSKAAKCWTKKTWFEGK